MESHNELSFPSLMGTFVVCNIMESTTKCITTRQSSVLSTYVPPTLVEVRTDACMHVHTYVCTYTHTHTYLRTYVVNSL